jgi:predicted phosphodiesterase
MGNKHSNNKGLVQGKIVSVYKKCFVNNDKSSRFVHGMLNYLDYMGQIETIEYCARDSSLRPGDVVTFSFSEDKSALNPYANNVVKHDLNTISIADDAEMKETEASRARVRLICISDTHNRHEMLTKYLSDIYESEADILVHCGDMTDSGSDRELQRVNKWFGKLPYKHIIVTAGNMDGIGLDRDGNKYRGSYYYDDRDAITDARKIFTNAVYLQHEAYHLKEYNLRFFASPYSMRFVGGFQVNNDQQAEKLWSAIPENTDILVCHGPPANILDLTSRGKHTGDQVLAKHVIHRVKPKVMCFGHMHSSFGHQQFKGIHFYNCAQEKALNGGSNYNSHSYSSSYKKSNGMKNENEKPHIIDLFNLA